MFYEIKDPFSVNLVKSMCNKTAHGLITLNGGTVPKYFECDDFVWNFEETKWENREVIKIPEFSFSIAWNGEMIEDLSHVLVNQKDWNVRQNILEYDENGELQETSGLDRFVEMEQIIYNHIAQRQKEKFEEEFRDKLPPKDERDDD